jgi:hypothetical protein
MIVKSILKNSLDTVPPRPSTITDAMLTKEVKPS